MRAAVVASTYNAVAHHNREKTSEHRADGRGGVVDKSTSVSEGSTSLWRNRAFTRLWFAQAVSRAGSEITNLALPLTAVLALGATPAQMGLLGIAQRLPELFFGLLAGVWVDRARRSPILVGSDLGRALLLGTIPLAAMLGYLTFAQLYVVAFGVGTLTVFFSLASVSILPALVRREQLVEANSRLAMSDSVLTIAGPGAAGGLVQLIGAPRAIVADALSYVLSALSLVGVGAAEKPSGREQRASVRAEIGEGIRELWRTPILRALAVSVSVGTFGAAMEQTVLVLFLVRALELPPAAIGLVYAFGGGGALVGAGLSGRAGRLFGTGRAIVLGSFLWALGSLLVALAGLAGTALPLILAGQAVAGLGGAIWGVNQMSLRQAVTPVGLFGRATAARRFLMYSMQIGGAGLGGVLGGVIGLRETLVIGALGLVAAFVLVVFSPVRAVRDLSDVAVNT
jgi:MFS family permease